MMMMMMNANERGAVIQWVVMVVEWAFVVSARPRRPSRRARACAVFVCRNVLSFGTTVSRNLSIVLSGHARKRPLEVPGRVTSRPARVDWPVGQGKACEYITIWWPVVVEEKLMHLCRVPRESG